MLLAEEKFQYFKFCDLIIYMLHERISSIFNLTTVIYRQTISLYALSYLFLGVWLEPPVKPLLNEYAYKQYDQKYISNFCAPITVLQYFKNIKQGGICPPSEISV